MPLGIMEPTTAFYFGGWLHVASPLKANLVEFVYLVRTYRTRQLANKIKMNLEVIEQYAYISEMFSVLSSQTLQRTKRKTNALGCRSPQLWPPWDPRQTASTICLPLERSAYMASRTRTRMPLLFSVQSDGGRSSWRPTTATESEGLLESCCCCAFSNSVCSFGSPLTSRTGVMASGLTVFRGVVASSRERGISPIPNGSRSC